MEDFKIMNLSLEAIQNLLGIKEKIPLTPQEMARTLRVTFIPFSKGEKGIELFAARLKSAMQEIGVEIIPYEEAVTLTKGKEKVRKGVITFAVGECEEGKFPIDYITTSRDNPIVTIIAMPEEVKDNLPYEKHIEIGLNLITWYMANIIVCVDKEKWIVYSFNGFSPFYKIHSDFKQTVLNNFIPKIATRVRPPLISEFTIKNITNNFTDDISTRPVVYDLIESGPLLERTGLFHSLKKVSEFKYKNKFYKRIASYHLDERRGMSYGFMAKQLPLSLPKPVSFGDIKQELNFQNKDYLFKENKAYVLVRIEKEMLVLEVPPIWIFMSRSGCEKTRLDPYKDILKIGLVNGELIMEIPPSVDLKGDYKPSFDTRIVFSHCLASTIYASILKRMNKNANYPKKIENAGIVIAHWHGNYLGKVPQGWYVYGADNPPVLCSSPQSAIYAFRGKESAIRESLSTGSEYLGDIHIEPQHGINVTWSTLKGLSNYLLSDSFIAEANRKVTS